MMSTRLFASVPYKSLTSFQDAAGALWLYHLVLAGHVFAVAGKSYRVMPIGDGRGDEDWLQAVGQTHKNAAQALGIAAPPDLTGFDMSKEADHSAWFFQMSSDLERLRLSAGLV